MEFREACRADACSKSDYQAFEDFDGLYVPLSSRDVQGRGSHIVLDTGWAARLYQEAYRINLRRQSPTHDLRPLLSLRCILRIALILAGPCQQSVRQQGWLVALQVAR